MHLSDGPYFLLQSALCGVCSIVLRDLKEARAKFF